MAHFSVSAKPSSAKSSVFLSTDSLSWSNRAETLLHEGRYDTALHCLYEAAKETPDINNYVSQVVCLIHLGQPQDALLASDRAIAMNSEHRQAWLFRGVALHRLGRFREAYACYDLALGQHDTKHRSSLWKGFRIWLKPLQSLVKKVLKGGGSHLPLH